MPDKLDILLPDLLLLSRNRHGEFSLFLLPFSLFSQ